MRQALEAEILKTKASLEAQISENRELAAKHQEALRVCDEDFKFKNEEMKSMEDFLKSQIDAYKREKETAEALLQSREK